MSPKDAAPPESAPSPEAGVRGGAATAPAAPTEPVPSPLRMTFEQFLEWLDEDQHAEWVDGEVVLMSPVSGVHQELVLFLLNLLSLFVEAHTAGVLRYDPFQMKAGPDLPSRAPDILFLANEHLDRLKPTYLEGPADVAVEVVSPDSRVRDRVDKFDEYEQGGVREYWLIDPLRRRAEFYALDETGIYGPVPVGADRIFRSGVLDGFWLNTDWLWQEPLPPVQRVLHEWGMLPAA
jgi:Uma2 family endonuclease